MCKKQQQQKKNINNKSICQYLEISTAAEKRDFSKKIMKDILKATLLINKIYIYI